MPSKQFCELQLSGELGARAISHLEEASDDGIAAMAAAQVVAVLLPTTAYVLRLKCPPARKMIDKGIHIMYVRQLTYAMPSGVAVALGSDFNPNAFCMSMVSGWIPQLHMCVTTVSSQWR